MPKCLTRFFLYSLSLAALLFLPACDKELPDLPTFYLEMGNAYNTLDQSQELNFEHSGLHYTVYNKPLIQPWNVLNVELVRVDSGKLALRFSFDDEGQRELYRTSVTNMGRMIVTVVDGKPIGARQIDGPMQGGVFYTFSELSEEELMELVPKMQESVREVNQMKRDNDL
jgi:hypothetical protein